MISISINLTDLPKEKITLAKNGKKYINLIVAELKQADQYGNTHTVFISQSKEERAAGEKKTYCGNGKQLSAPAQPTFTQAAKQAVASMPVDDSDGLPF